MKKNSNITGIILAGGKSIRMGRDKGLMLYKNKPFIKHIIKALQPVVSEIIIVSNSNKYDHFKIKRVNDIIKNAGPLAGVYTGLHHSKTENNLVLSCDIPLINTETLQNLVNEIDGVSEIIQIESMQKTMPLIALYKKQCAATFLNLLNDGERRLRVAVNKCNVKTVKLNSESDEYVMNINTKDQFYELKN